MRIPRGDALRGELVANQAMLEVGGLKFPPHPTLRLSQGQLQGAQFPQRTVARAPDTRRRPTARSRSGRDEAPSYQARLCHAGAHARYPVPYATACIENRS
eukprot:scaffold127585_cov51-Phaeocystis_antarctica.AAC.1